MFWREKNTNIFLRIKLDDQDLKSIIKSIKSGRCLAFLGAGACTEYVDKNNKTIPGLCTGGELAEWLAGKCESTNGKINDLTKISEIFVYEHGGDRQPLEAALKEKIQIRCNPRPIHSVLAQIPQIKIFMTSNYDSLMERELNKYGRKLARHVHNPLNPKTGHYKGTEYFGEQDKNIAILHKMHGSIEETGSIIITQSDYIQYLANLNDVDRGMPLFFRKTIIPNFTLLFLGYSLEDWNFRVIWEGVLSDYSYMNVKKEAYALVKSPSHFLKKYWTRRNIDVCDEDLTDFAKKLADYFNLEIPQLGIKKRKKNGNE